MKSRYQIVAHQTYLLDRNISHNLKVFYNENYQNDDDLSTSLFYFFTLNFAIKLMVTSIGLFLIIPIENLSRQAVAEHDYLARPRLPLKSVI